jgi:hypothetical protein
MSTFHCDLCNNDKTVPEGSFGTGYASREDGSKICYECCGQLDRQTMLEEGNSRCLPLYLSTDKTTGKSKISNCPGTLTFPVGHVRKGRHNIARTRTDVWFRGPDNKEWWGVLYGQWTQIVHCRRTKGS